MSDIDQFTVYKQNASMAFVIDPQTPLLGSGSLRMHRNGVSARFMHAIRSVGSRAFTSGRARFIVGCKARQNNDECGMAFMVSGDLTGGTGYCYICNLIIVNAGQAGLILYRSNNLGLTTLVQIVQGPSFTFTTGVTKVAVEVTWVQDPANLGGGNPAIQIIVKRGADITDFSDLVTETGMDVIETTNVITTTTGEGPCLRLAATSSLGDFLIEFPPSGGSPAVQPLIVGG